MSALLAGGCAVLVVAALWELIGERGEEAGARLRRRLSATSTRSVGGVALAPFVADVQRRIERASLERGLSPAAVLAAKLAGGIISLPLALAAAPVAPGRTGYLVLIGVPVAAFLVPDLLLERAARSRRRRIGAALPDALDLMATGAASGRSAGAMMAEAMRSSSGPLRDELARAVAAIECGCSQEQALRTLRERSRGDNLGSLATALERSRRHGSPLSRAMHEQAGSLRGDQRRAIGERAARAAPKMQLVVALLLVPSVLLMVAAAILANSGSLLPSF
ncbi:MAG: type II secretion system F family protein [Solirubrobacterales bacterium]